MLEIDSARMCLQGHHELRPRLKLVVLPMLIGIKNPMPSTSIRLGPGSGNVNKKMYEFQYIHHYCPECGLTYYFPPVKKEEKDLIDKLTKQFRQ